MKSNYHLIPIYCDGDVLLVIHELDFQQDSTVKDGLIVAVCLASKTYTPAMSGQRYLKFCPCDPIPFDEQPYWIDLMERQIPASVLQEVEETLRWPTVKAVKTLCWVPERLKRHLVYRLPMNVLGNLKAKIGVN